MKEKTAMKAKPIPMSIEKGYDYLKHLEEHTGHKLNLSGRERLYIASEIDRRTTSYLHLKGILKEVLNAENTDNIETYNRATHHLTTHRK